MTCTFVTVGDVQVVTCTGDMELAWILSMCDMEGQEREHAEEMRMLDVGDALEFQHVQAEFCDLREAVDPYWPPRDLEPWYEEAERDPAMTYPGAA